MAKKEKMERFVRDMFEAGYEKDDLEKLLVELVGLEKICQILMERHCGRDIEVRNNVRKEYGI